uniref:Thiamine pyrophosphate-requiring protein n=1 Tax=Thermocrispum agreste TaxID=37925 RepID=A0A2W4JIX6_9PSEU|nr:MAG: thiamine pyrophosphate-requiring protein [Thermocrispum agreste]
MSITVADHLVARLQEWGVAQLFGYSGDGINGILAALGRAGNRPRFVQTRHEETAAFAAVGRAKFSGRPAVCLATSGPGAVHLLNGLYDALLDHVPVVAVVGQTARTAMGGSYQQEIDLQALFKDVAHAYLVEINAPEQLPNALDRAMRTAEAQRTVTALIIPADVQDLPYRPPAHEFKHVPSSPPARLRSVTLPDRADLQAAADVLNAGSRPAILIGQGARGAAGEIRRVAELLGAGVAKALLGKDVLPDDLPYVTGSIGLLGTRASWQLMSNCDTLLIVGSSFPYSQFLPEFGQARAVQIDLDGGAIGMRYPVDVPLVGDASATLRALLPLLDSARDPSWGEWVRGIVADWRSVVEQQALLDADPVNPMRIVWELSARLPEDAVVTGDSGSVANWYARQLQIRGSIRCSLSGTLASMGSGVPYAIGAKFADPHRPVVALVGDGAMQMNGMAELLTVRHYHHLWPDRRFAVCVLHNNDLNQVTWEQRALGGDPKFEPSQTLPDVSYAEVATAFGLEGIRVEEPDAIGPAWDRALSADHPVVLDVICDPEVPPVPPHVGLDQLSATAAALAKGDRGAWRMLMQGVRSKAQEFAPGE